MKRLTERTDNGIRVGGVEYTEPKELVTALMMLADYEDSELDPVEFQESVKHTLSLNKRLRPFFNKYSEGCKYHINLPIIGKDTSELCCDAYSQSKRPDGKHWAHYPKCAGMNCPRLYPELLKGAKLGDTSDT